MSEDKGLLGTASKLLGFCGHGKDHNWSVRVADYFFVDCACCIFWRGVLFGGGIMGLTFGIIAIIVIIIILKSGGVR